MKVYDGRLGCMKVWISMKLYGGAACLHQTKRKNVQHTFIVSCITLIQLSLLNEAKPLFTPLYRCLPVVSTIYYLHQYCKKWRLEIRPNISACGCSGTRPVWSTPTNIIIIKMNLKGSGRGPVTSGRGPVTSAWNRRAAAFSRRWGGKPGGGAWTHGLSSCWRCRNQAGCTFHRSFTFPTPPPHQWHHEGARACDKWQRASWLTILSFFHCSSLIASPSFSFFFSISWK